MKINRNQVLIAVGFLATQGPNLSAVAAWLAKSGIPHLTGVVNMLGWVATALGGLALAWPRIRSTLAAAGLATPRAPLPHGTRRGTFQPAQPRRERWCQSSPRRPARSRPRALALAIQAGSS